MKLRDSLESTRSLLMVSSKAFCLDVFRAAYIWGFYFFGAVRLPK